MYPTNIIAAGCSFTQDGICGCPPTDDSEGGNSFLDYPEDNLIAAIPKSWAGIVAKKLNAKSFINVAASGHGNLVLSNSILALLEKFPYQSSNTLILFNITDPTRLDIPCSFEHVDRSMDIPWTSDIIEHSYLSTQSTILKKVKQEIGPDSISYLSTNPLSMLLDLLKYKKYRFAFMTMADYSADKYLSPVLAKHQKNFLPFGDQIGMMEFCVTNKMTISTIDRHPNLKGHESIAEKMIDFLK